MEELRRRIKQLSQQQRALLSLRLGEQISGTTSTSADKDRRNQCLIAYVVPAEPETELNPSQLRNYLHSKLPDYMIPSVFVQCSALPRTPNGKIDLQSLPEPDTRLSVIETPLVAPRNPTEKILVDIWSEILGLEEISIDDNFFEVGGDSILSIQIVSKAREAGLSLMPNQLFEHQTIAELGAVVNQPPVVEVKQDLVTGSVPLTPIQQWFFEQQMPEPQHWNQSMLLEVPPDLELDWLERAIQELWLHHDALRLHFRQEQTGWQQFQAGTTAKIAIAEIDLSHLSPEEQRVAMEKQATALHSSLNLTEGNLIRVAFFNLGIDRPGYLLIIIHNLVVDNLSWEILRQDLETLYNQLRHQEEIQLPPKTTSFQSWAQELVTYARSDTLEQEAHEWLSRLDVKAVKIPRDGGERIINTEASAQRKSTSLNVEETLALLHDLAAAYNTQINDVLLTALAQALALQHKLGAESKHLIVDLESHGREAIGKSIDVSRTVGWFTSLFPVALNLSNLSEAGVALKSIKEQLRQIPERGIGYGLLRYLRGDKNLKGKLETLPQAEILFNYLGQKNQPTSSSSAFRVTSEPSGDARNPQNTRSYLLEINASIAQKQLQIDWIYAPQVHSAVEEIIRDFMSALRTLIEHGRSPETVGFTPSDFPEADLNQEELDDFLSRLS